MKHYTSVIAGALWSAFGVSATFLAGAAFAAATAFGLLAVPISPRAVKQETVVLV
jgi:hypothetical protein